MTEEDWIAGVLAKHSLLVSTVIGIVLIATVIAVAVALGLVAAIGIAIISLGAVKRASRS